MVTDYLGLIAGALATFAMVPQIIRVFKLKSAREISLLFNTMLLAGIICWLAYGILMKLKPIIFWNTIGATLVALLLYAKIKYGKQG